MSKKNEIILDLTPQNLEWIELIPFQNKNIEIVFNKLLSTSIENSNFLEVISKTLNVSDLQKFKTSFLKMQNKRNECLEILKCPTESKNLLKENISEEKIEIDVVKTPHGFAEDTF